MNGKYHRILSSKPPFFQQFRARPSISEIRAYWIPCLQYTPHQLQQFQTESRYCHRHHGSSLVWLILAAYGETEAKYIRSFFNEDSPDLTI